MNGEMAIKDTYIALDGSGCARVCQDTTFAASTIHLPCLSHECSGCALSDEATPSEITHLHLAQPERLRKLPSSVTEFRGHASLH